ncbi:MAG: hypothetical protein AABX35_01240 [Nanoarchaeota archaeon]
MENKQITLREIYIELKNLEQTLKRKGIITQLEISKNSEIVRDFSGKSLDLADEDLLAEDWLSPEDEEAWKDL